MRRLPCLLIVFILAAPTSAAEPLHIRIDQVLERNGLGLVAPLCDDATFVRRAYLDLAGMIPSGDQTRAFLSDTKADKRAVLVNQLIAGEPFNRRLADMYDITLMERRTAKNVKQAEWRAYLLNSVRADKPYNVLAQEILASDGADPKLRPAARFFLDRDSEPTLMTRDVGRVFFGMDLQCAQCHDHPSVDDYIQRNYYGIHAFVSRTYVFDDKKAKKKVLAEKPEGDTNFTSVFTEQAGFSQPRLPGEVGITDPVFALGDEYKVKPAKDVRSIPKFSRRGKMAELVGSGGNEAFNRNIANRLWAFVMGRGIVEPLDYHHTSNPPTNPELLDLLTSELRTIGFDVRQFVREIALTNAYQRSLALPGDLTPHKSAAEKQVAELSASLAEQEKQATAAEVAFLESVEAVVESRGAMLPVREKREKAKKSWSESMKKTTAAAAPMVESTKKRDAAMKIVTALKPALDSVSAAAVSLPSDKELSAVAVALKAKYDKHAKELAAIDKTLATQTAAHQKAVLTSGAAAKEVETIRSQLKTLHAASAVEEAKLVSADKRRRQVVLAMKLVRSRLEAAKTYLAAVNAEPQAKTGTEGEHREALVNAWTKQFALGDLKPLTPEQFAWSVMQVGGLVERQTSATRAELEKKSPLDDAAKKDPTKVSARGRQAESAAFDKLSGNAAAFVGLYGGGPGQPQGEFFATVEQALFMSNGSQLQSWLAPSGDNATARVLKLTDSAKMADEIYLSVLSRFPSDSERGDVAEYLKGRDKDRTAAIQEMSWALATSIEFRFNH